MEEFKVQLKQLKKKLREAEKRAVHAERTVKKLLKDVDMKEGRVFSRWRSTFFSRAIFFNDRCVLDELREEKEKYKAVCDDMDATFAEMTGY